MEAFDSFSNGFESLFVEDWPFLLIGAALYFVYMAIARLNQVPGERLPFLQRPATGFFGALILIIVSLDTPTAWWIRAIAFAGILIVGAAPRLKAALSIPIAVGYGYLIWIGTAPGVSVAGHIILLAIWELVLCFVLLNLRGLLRRRPQQAAEDTSSASSGTR